MKSRPRMRAIAFSFLALGLLIVLAACGTSPVTHTLTVSVEGSGSGSVVSDPAGIETDVAGGNEASFTEGTVVSLTATADVGSTFTGWAGACAGAAGATCDVTVDASKSVTARFELPGTLFFSQDANSNGLYELNMDTGTSALVGSGTSGVTGSTVGLAGRAANEPLVGSTWSTLVETEQDGSGATQFSTESAEGLTYVASSDLVYAITNNDFRSISPSTGLVVEDLMDPADDLEGLAADESTGIIYAVGNDTNLWAYDISADSWSVVFDTTINWDDGGLAFNEVEGLLYAIGATSGTTDALYSIDPVAQTVTEVGSTALSPAKGGLAWVPAP